MANLASVDSGIAHPPEAQKPATAAGRPRVLVVENDSDIRERTITKLRYSNYQPVAAEGQGRALLADAAAKARDFRCQLAIVDMHLLDDYDHTDWSGLNLIKELFPTRSIILSGSVNFQAVRNALSEAKALEFVNKSEGPEFLRQVLDKRAAEFCACRRAIPVQWPDQLSSAQVNELFFAGDPRVPADEADDVLIRLFPEASRLRLEIIGGIHTVSPSLPRPRSLVLKVYEDEKQPVIVKLARAHKIRKEIDNHEKYIKRQLAGSYCPNLEESCVLWDIGGAVYSFVGNSDNIIPFSKFYQQAKVKGIKDTLRQFFTITWSPHYQRASEETAQSLFDVYCLSWGGRWWLDLLIQYEQEGLIAAALTESSSWKELGAPDPVLWLKERAEAGIAGDFERIRLAVTHGDLHSENLLIDADRLVAWVIDFERTGIGHVLQDYVELEADLINRTATFSEAEYRSFYALCLCVAGPARLNKPCGIDAGDPELERTLAILSFLRRTAAGQTGITSAREYVWGLMMNALFRALTLIRSGSQGNSLKRALMLASILCYRLEHWEEAWPPETWPMAKEVQPEELTDFKNLESLAE